MLTYERKPVKYCNGNSINTVKILKKSCKAAAASAFLNSFFLEIYPSDTIVLVTVVPIFAPITIGIALSKEIVPAATMATTREVTVELLWIIAVVNIPIKKPTKGFDVASIICLTISWLSKLNALLIRFKDRKNAKNIAANLRSLLL